MQLSQRPERCILIVDDEEVIRNLCAKVLQGYRILQAADGEEALRVLEREKADVVLTDVMMPQMSGLELLKTLKEREPTQVVVMMTGFADKEVILRALKADADDFINKPINLLQLKTTIDRALEKKALREELVHLQLMDRLKSDFLGLISHKLKTPTTAISLFMQNIARGIGDPEDPDFQKTVGLILEETRHLNYLIQDLLIFSDVLLQEGPAERAPVDPSDVARTVAGELRQDFANKGIALSLDIPARLPEMPLDRRQVTFALRALLENALKFSSRGGQVALEAVVTPEEVRLVVRDNGPGIPKEELPKVFEKFYQVDPERTGQVRGFGLGLFYARQFAQNHGGNVLLESEPGKGTTASLILPR
jgi:hypothetical protein